MSQMKFKQETYLGLQCMTKVGYLFITAPGRGVWVPKAMTFNLVIHNDNLITAMHPTCMNRLEHVDIKEPVKHDNTASKNGLYHSQQPNPYSGFFR